MLKPSARLRPLVLCLAGSCALFAGCTGTSATGAAGTGGGGRGGGGRAGGGGPVPVVVGKASQRDVPVNVEAIGNVEAYTTISVRSQVTGVLTEVLFKEGDYVKTGDHLFTIDPRPYQAALQQAQANLIRDQALLEQAKAQLAKDAASAEYSQTTSERNSQLAKNGIISKDQSEQSAAAADASTATVNADKANIASAQAQLVAQQAAVDSAKVALDYTVIRSPITGRTGNLTIKPGNLVTANNSELMTIAQVQPVFVTFSVPSTHLPDIKRRIAVEKLPVVATPQDADAQPVSGMLSFYDNVVDTATDTIKLKATFANDDRRLWPGEFAKVSLQLDTLANATTVSTEAVQTGQDGQFVFVVKGDTVEQRPVTTGQRFNEDIVIAKGLNPGETVVTEGQLRLEPGSRVTIADPRTGEAAAQQGGGRGGRGQGGNRQGGGQGQGGQGGQGGGNRQGGGNGDGGNGQNGGRRNGSGQGNSQGGGQNQNQNQRGN